MANEDYWVHANVEVSPEDAGRVLFGIYLSEGDAEFARKTLEGVGRPWVGKTGPLKVNLNDNGLPGQDKRWIVSVRRSSIKQLTPNHTVGSNRASVDYLLALYNSSDAEFRSSEETGDRRVNLYIAIVTAVTAGLIALITKGGVESTSTVSIVVFGTIFAMSVLGISVLLRIIQRNRSTDEYIRSMKNVGKYFVLNDPQLMPYLSEFDPFREKSRRSYRTGPKRLGFGGLLEMVILLNSIIAAALPLLLLLAITLTSSPDQEFNTAPVPAIIGLWVISALLLGAGTWCCQSIYARQRFLEDERTTHSPTGTFRGETMDEIETTLIICSREPALVTERLGGLSTVGAYELDPQPHQEITDTYLDTADDQLDHRKIGLRIRDVNGSRLITLKGPTRVDSRGISHRLEVEESWSQEALEIVMKKLKLEGVGIADSDATAAKHDPLDAMSRMGLVRIQSRKNSREVRNVISVKGALRRTVAELVIDTVTFDFGGTPIKLSEVEIEARVDTGQSLSKVADELIEVFPNELRRWSHSKLATGLALSELSKAGKLDGKRVLSADGYLLPKGYALVDSILQDRESAAS